MRFDRHIGFAMFAITCSFYAIERPAMAETAAGIPGEHIEVRHLEVDADHRFEDARGLHIALQYRVGKVSVEKALFLVARVHTRSEEKVHALVKSAAFRDRNDGSLHGKKQLIAVPRGAWREASIFIPFYAMKLSPGNHTISLKLEAVSDPGRCKFGEIPRIVRVSGENETGVELTKPPFKQVQLLIRTAHVSDESADVAVWPWSTLPDLKWRLRFQAGAGGVIYTSKVRDNTASGSWNRYSSEFPFSQGDRLTISVLDQDVMGSDDLGSLKLTLAQLEELQKSPRPLKAGKASSIVLGPIKIR